MREEVINKYKKLLSDCYPSEAFWTNKGIILRNIYELVNCLEFGTDEHCFRYHVNTDNGKNDFALWIRAVFKDDELADRLQKVYDRKKYLKIIKQKVKEAESNTNFVAPIQ